MPAAVCSDPKLGPVVAVTRLHPQSIEERGDIAVGRDLSQVPDEIDDVAISGVPVLACAVLFHLETSVAASGPPNDERDGAMCVVDIGEDFFDHGPDQPFLHRHVGRRIVPHCREIFT